MLLNYIFILNTTSIIHYVHSHQSLFISSITVHNHRTSSVSSQLSQIMLSHIQWQDAVQSFLHACLSEAIRATFPTNRLCSCSRYLFVFFRFRNLKKMSPIPSKGTNIRSANMIRSWRFIHINYNCWLPFPFLTHSG